MKEEIEKILREEIGSLEYTIETNQGEVLTVLDSSDIDKLIPKTLEKICGLDPLTVSKEEYDKLKSFYDKNFEKMLSMIDFKEMYFDSFNADEIIKANVNGSDVYIVSNRVDLSEVVGYFDSKEIDLAGENFRLRIMYDEVSSKADRLGAIFNDSEKAYADLSKMYLRLESINTSIEEELNKIKSRNLLERILNIDL
jgi:hypothetical protein